MSAADLFDISGKTALVTGGSRGLGRAIALALAGQGADVAINYRGNAEAADAVVAEITGMGRAATAIQGDTSAGRESCEAIVKAAIDEFGKVDILVNNAGITRDNLMMRPERALIIGRAMARVIQNGPDRFVSMTASHSSSPIRMSRLSRVMPALFTRMCTDPRPSSAALTIASHASRPADVSPWMAVAVRPSAVISATTASAASALPR